jgi:predicted amidohydrolase
MKAAAVQLASGLDREANRSAAVAAVRSAAASGAALVVLPEATMCGFGSARTDLSEYAEPLDGPFVTALAAVAAESGVTVVAGTFEPAEMAHRVYNTLAIVGRDGLVARYRKVHLYDALGWCESDRVCAGDPDASNAPVVEVGGFSLGVLTCYDLRFPESARAAVDAGATVLAVPAAWVAGPRKVDHWRTLLGARAIENTAYVVAAGQPAPTYTGHSQIVDTMGDVVASLGADEGTRVPALVEAELSEECLNDARAALPVLAHRRFGVGARRDGAVPRP